MHKWLVIIYLSFLGVSCSNQVENLKVDKFTLRNYQIQGQDVPMVRGDQQKRLYGAVTLKEHEARLGQYYEVRWNLKGKEHMATDSKNGALVIFRYRQASTASQLKLISKQYPAGQNNGKIDFQIIGEEYIQKGRVLAWKAELVLGGRVVDSKQSFLWQR